MLFSSWWIVFRVKIVFNKRGKYFRNNFGQKVRGPWPPWPLPFLRLWASVRMVDRPSTWTAWWIPNVIIKIKTLPEDGYDWTERGVLPTTRRVQIPTSWPADCLPGWRRTGFDTSSTPAVDGAWSRLPRAITGRPDTAGGQVRPWQWAPQVSHSDCLGRVLAVARCKTGRYYLIGFVWRVLSLCSWPMPCCVDACDRLG